MIANSQCQHCGGDIEFEAENTGEWGSCPHCGKSTVMNLPPKRYAKIKSEGLNLNVSAWMAANKIWWIVGCVVIVGLVVWAASAPETPEGQFSFYMLPAFLLTLLVAGVGLGFMVLVYFFPSIVAMRRQKSNSSAIFVLNLLTGWTFIGWVIACVWAYTVDPPQK